MPIILFIVILSFDLIVKYLIRSNFELNQSFVVIEGIFNITYIENTGAAFGLFANLRVFLIIATVGILLVLLIHRFYFVYRKNSLYDYALSLICAGAIGNLIDRLVKSSVTDMFDFIIWPIFNVADIAVCCGAILMSIYFLKHSS